MIKMIVALVLQMMMIMMMIVVVVEAVNNCNSINKNGNDVPCIDIKSCDSSNDKATITINKLSDGKGPSLSSSLVSLCYDNDGLNINVEAYNQLYYNGIYSHCNDAIFNLDVNEVFIAPDVDGSDPHCYNEIDMSPTNVMYEAGIYNPNLNHTGLVNKLYDCTLSGVIHESQLDLSKATWTSKLLIPWSVIHCPVGCPLSTYEASCNNIHNYGQLHNIYRANFYRINEIVSTSTCSSGYSSPQTCEYNAWSPTDVYPPSFHEPPKFGYLVLV